MTSETTIWMGDLEEYMDRNFVIHAFHQMGEPVVNVKHIINKQIVKNPYGKQTPHAYCFVEFPDPQTTQRVMLRLNGKIIPGSNPPVRFKLNHASYGKGSLMGSEYSLFVGDLTEDVDDFALFSVFSKRYKSCRTAKVVLDNDGKKRGYGFVRFTDEGDQMRALNEMNNYSGIGRKPIRVSLAAPKRPPGNNQQYNPYGNYYQNYQYPYHQQQNYWQGYNQSNYYQYYQGYPQDGSQTQSYDTTAATTSTNYTPTTNTGNDSDSDALEDPCEEIDVAKMNKEYMEQSEEFYTALEASRWNALDSVTSQLAAEAS